MTTCKTCKHWFTDDPEQVIISGRGICLLANSVQSDDGRRTMSSEDSQAHALTTVAASFGYHMAINQLETTAEFGCNQFES